MSSLDQLLASSRYGRGKLRLKQELEGFLRNICHTDLAQASPVHIRQFLVYKERFGKTRVHIHSYSLRGGTGNGACPHRLAWATLDSLIGQVRAIFRDIGRGSEWLAIWGVGNPAASPLIKGHVKTVKLEQTRAAVPIRRAVPLLFDKILKITRYLSYKLSLNDLSAASRYILMRDRAYLKLICHSGDRGGDLGQLFCRAIVHPPSVLR